MSHNLELFEPSSPPGCERLAEGAGDLAGLRGGCSPELIAAVRRIESEAPPRHMQIPGGARMSVAMTSCGMQAG
jgi:DNA oxidative demethylase